MNIHPFIVHFPVAFLSVYCLMELVRLRYITSTVYWFYIKATLVIIGAVGAVAAFLSGKVAVELVGKSQLIETHSRWGKSSMIIFGIIAGLYAIAWLSRLETVNRIENFLKLNDIRVYTVFKKIINYLVESFIMVLPALAGLTAILVTGALGGAIVYGVDNDPFIRFIYNLMF